MQRASGRNVSLAKSKDVKSTASVRMRKHFPRFFNQGDRHVLLSAKQLSGGMTNHTYFARTKSSAYIARMPGVGSDTLINREHESHNTRIAIAAGLTPEVVYDEENGKKVTRYLNQPVELSESALRRPENMLKVIEVLKKLHHGQPFANSSNIFVRNREWIKKLYEKKIDLPWKFVMAVDAMNRIEKELSQDAIPDVPCHMDTTPGNFVFSENKLFLIDFEYAGNFDALWDLAYLSVEADLTSEQNDFMLRAYFGDGFTEQIKRRFTLYQPAVEYHIGLWNLMQIANGNEVVSKEKFESEAKIHINRCNTLVSLLPDTPQQIEAQEEVEKPQPLKRRESIFKPVKTALSRAKDMMHQSKKSI